MTDDIYLITEGGIEFLREKHELHLQMQSDPNAVVTLNAAHLEKIKKGEQLSAKLTAGETVSEEDFKDAYGDMARIVGGFLGIINVKGPIETSEKYWHTYCGIPSYERIDKIVDTMVQMGTIKEILWVWNSPGGNARGCFACAKHIGDVQKGGIAMTSFVETGMMSAAIAIGTVPKKIYTVGDADVGSVGAMTTLFNYTEAYKQAGVEAKTFKYGRLKDIGSPYRARTKEEDTFFQNRVNSLGIQIVSTVQTNRKMSAEQFMEAAGEAKIVFGTEAAVSGLVDGVRTFDEVVNAIIAGHNAPQAQPAIKSGAANMKKYRLNAQGLAAVAAGLPQPEALKMAAYIEEDDTPEGGDENLNGGGAEVETDLTNENLNPEGGTQKPTPATEVQTDLTALVTQLSDEKAKSIGLQGQLTALQEKETKLQTQNAALLEIAAKAVLNMEVACGNTTVSVDSLKAMGVDGLVARHTEVTTLFKTKLRAGPIARVDTQARVENTKRPVAVAQSRMDAVLGGGSDK